MGALVRDRLTPDVVINSDAVRPRLTAEAVVAAARCAGEILLDQRLYMANPADILSLLRTVPGEAETVMIVGHNPGLEELVAQLTGERQDLPTAALRRSSCRSISGAIWTVDPRDPLGPLAGRKSQT